MYGVRAFRFRENFWRSFTNDDGINVISWSYCLIYACRLIVIVNLIHIAMLWSSTHLPIDLNNSFFVASFISFVWFFVHSPNWLNCTIHMRYIQIRWLITSMWRSTATTFYFGGNHLYYFSSIHSLNLECVFVIQHVCSVYAFVLRKIEVTRCYNAYGIR